MIMDAGILPSVTGDVKGNTPGKDGEAHNGAFTVQIVEVNGHDTSHLAVPHVKGLPANPIRGTLPLSSRRIVRTASKT